MGDSLTFLGKTGRRFSRVLVTVALLTIMVFVTSVWAMMDRGLSGVVIVDYVPVRSTPELMTATIAQLVSGQVVDLTGYRSADGAWLQVRLPGVEGGWVPSESIRSRLPAADLSIATATGATSAGVPAFVTGEIIPVRQGIGYARPIFVQLSHGERVELTGFRSADGAWIQVQFSGNQMGWVEAAAIASDYPLSALTQAEVEP
jgi:uncharacterized protein YgiM (DUF1202 family)